MKCTIEHTWNVKRLLEFIFESKSQRDIRHTGGLLGAWSLSPIIYERPSATARPGSIFMIIFWGEISIYLLQTNGTNGAWWGWTPVWAYKLDFKFHMLGSCKDSQLCLVSNSDDTQYVSIGLTLDLHCHILCLFLWLLQRPWIKHLYSDPAIHCALCPVYQKCLFRTTVC